jgi:methionine-S-sulfoxide reductase
MMSLQQPLSEAYKSIVALLILALMGANGLNAQPKEATMTPQRELEKATLAGGCFWGMEDILRKIPGVIETTVGYTGGTVDKPTYPVVSAGTSGHAEAVEVTYDQAQLSFEELLGWFFRMHDPTTVNRQGNDIGSQYRSTIFFHSPEQKQTAERVIAAVNASKRWARPVVTTLEPAGPFFAAEGYHQDYLVKNPGGYTCHYLRD